MIGECDRRPPDGWPGDKCHKRAMYYVTYKIIIGPEDRHINVCNDHLKEMFSAKAMGIIQEIKAQGVKLHAAITD